MRFCAAPQQGTVRRCAAPPSAAPDPRHVVEHVGAAVERRLKLGTQLEPGDAQEPRERFISRARFARFDSRDDGLRGARALGERALGEASAPASRAEKVSGIGRHGPMIAYWLSAGSAEPSARWDGAVDAKRFAIFPRASGFR
jgi:hypothetical protein